LHSLLEGSSFSNQNFTFCQNNYLLTIKFGAIIDGIQVTSINLNTLLQNNEFKGKSFVVSRLQIKNHIRTVLYFI
jgi:hypothetical protein